MGNHNFIDKSEFLLTYKLNFKSTGLSSTW